MRRTGQRALVVVCLVILLAAAGCSRTEPDQLGESVAVGSGSATSTGSPGSSDSGDLGRTASGESPHPVDAGTIATYALGRIVVGMTLDEAEATGLILWDRQVDRPSSFLYRPSRDVIIGGNDVTGITGFMVKNDSHTTPEGITPRVSDDDDVEAAYGDSALQYESETGYTYYLVRDGDFGYYIQLDPESPNGKTVQLVIAGNWAPVSAQKPLLPYIG